jgi:hypothetical protein
MPMVAVFVLVWEEEIVGSDAIVVWKPGFGVDGRKLGIKNLTFNLRKLFVYLTLIWGVSRLFIDVSSDSYR